MGRQSPGFLDRRIARRWSDADVKAEVQRIQSVIAEQNATNGDRAEENLRRATELDPANEVAMSYLAALYYWWVDSNTDSLGNQRRSRRDDALRVYKHILEISPQHKFANYVCGVIYYEKAFEGMRAAGYPGPISSDAAGVRFRSRPLRC